MSLQKIAALLLAVCAFSGCTASPAGVDTLLRAPRVMGEQSGVHKALTAYLGESPQLKYPMISLQGEAVSPFVLEDFDGNGTQDAAAFYVSAAKGQNVHLAILEQGGDDQWTVTQEKEGLAASVESISTAQLQAEGGNQLLVGYVAGSGEKYLAVYAYRESTLEEVLTIPYSQYQLHPLASEAASDLMIIGPEQTSPLQLQLLTAENGQFTLAQQLDLNERFLDCDGLYPSVGEDGNRYLVLDGHTATGLASSILHYDSRLQRLENYVPVTEDNFFDTTQRFSSLLRSRDINGDDRVEIPCQVDAGEVGALTVNRLSLISWMDFTSEYEQEVSFGVADLEYGYYVPLPSELKGSVMITGGEEPESWQMRSLDGEELYLTVKIVTPNVRSAGYFRMGNIGAKKVLARVSSQIGMTASELADGFTVL